MAIEARRAHRIVARYQPRGAVLHSGDRLGDAAAPHPQARRHASSCSTATATSARRPAVPTGCFTATRASSRISSSCSTACSRCCSARTCATTTRSLTVDLTNPDIYSTTTSSLPKDTVAHRAHDLSVARHRLSAAGGAQLRRPSDRPAPVACCSTATSPTCSRCAALRRDAPRRGQRAERSRPDAVRSELSTGLDGELRRTTLRFDPPPSELATTAASYRLDARAGAKRSRSSSPIGCGTPQPPDASPASCAALRAARRASPRHRASAATVETSNDLFNEVLCRSMADLYMLMTEHAARALSLCRHPLVLDHVRPRRPDHRAADAAGSIPRIARGVLRRLAAYQANDRRSGVATPSRARSCTRCAAARWRPCARCRSASTTAASTPRRCSSCSPASMSSAPATTRRIAELWPAIEAALGWIDGPGDPDGDGFVEY